MLATSPPALLPLVLVLSFAGAGALCAQEQPPVAAAPSSTWYPPDDPPPWPDWTADAEFRRLPPPEEFRYEEQPAVPQPGGGQPLLGGPPGRGAPLAVRAEWIPHQDVRDQSSDLAVSRQELELAFPVRKDAGGLWLAMGSLQRLEIDTMAVFPDSGLAVPDQLWDIQVGAMHLRELLDGRRVGGMLRVGSPSDRPFGALRDMTLVVLGFLTVPAGPRDAWNFSLYYSPTAQIIFPIPGLAYRWRPDDRFQVDLGIPFALEYRPSEVWTLSASYRPLTDVQVLARRALGERWSVYGGYRTVNEAFLLAEREIDRERTYVFQQRLELGLQRQLGGRWSLDVSAAYVFDRQIFQAESFSRDRRDELAVDPGMAGMLQLQWTR